MTLYFLIKQLFPHKPWSNSSAQPGEVITQGEGSQDGKNSETTGPSDKRWELVWVIP